MKEIETQKLKDRKGEKGAVMVMVLLISFLLLIASAGILLETSMNTANVSDATADQQAYNAAESGIQSALNVLRRNVKPSPLFNSDSNHPDNQIDFKKALKRETSNLSSDAANEPPRLSRWGLAYDPDRVKIGSDKSKGYAYKISLSDPDNTGVSLTYSTVLSESGIADAANPKVFASSRTFGNGTTAVTITYIPQPTTTLTFSGDSAPADFGKFQITLVGSSGTLPSDVRFKIALATTSPYDDARVMRGVIKAGTFYAASTGTARFEFDSQGSVAAGSNITLASRSVAPVPSNTGQTPISGSMTPSEPRRILIRSTGYGPRGAQKQLEAMVQKGFLNGLAAPAALTMVGSSVGFEFNAGNSNNVLYSGDDYATTNNIPSIGVTNSANLNYVLNNLPKTAPNPPPADVDFEMPDWLSSPAELDKTIKMYYDTAVRSQRLYGSNGLTAPNFGDNYTATGITFIDGDASFSGSGGGILICTGNLTLNGGVDFNGLIIVTGAGGFDRSGGGGGSLQGNTVIAPYAKSRMLKNDGTPADKDGIATASFLGPKYDISGGGNSELRYNSSSVANGLTAVSNIVLGIAEK